MTTVSQLKTTTKVSGKWVVLQVMNKLLTSKYNTIQDVNKLVFEAFLFLSKTDNSLV